MRLLFDMNVLIPADPTSAATLEANSQRVADLIRAAGAAGHVVVVHPAVRYDIARGDDMERQALRRLLLGKYVEIPDPPPVPTEWTKALGEPARGSNDWVDNQHLAALSRHAAHLLVTEDRGIHRKAKRVGLEARVVTVADALAIVSALAGADVAPPPAVKNTVCHAFDVRDLFFDSLRSDYGPSFDEWLIKCQHEQRRCWLVRGSDGALAAIAIYKDEKDEFEWFRGNLLKLCTFKVADAHRGRRLGELLLKAAFHHAAANRHDAIYVTVFPKHEHLVALFEDFGFEQRAENQNGELLLLKELRPDRARAMSALEFHLRHGPPALALNTDEVFVVPIEPKFHHLLFPDAEEQLELDPGKTGFGNGLRKAYLCRANTRRLPAGAALLFYRSRQGRLVRVIGVAEAHLRSTDPDEIAAFVGKRTVYPYRDIEAMSRKGSVLAILFRQAVVLDTPIPYDALAAARALSGPPQSITRFNKEALPWLQQHLEQASCFPFGRNSLNRS